MTLTAKITTITFFAVVSVFAAFILSLMQPSYSGGIGAPIDKPSIVNIGGELKSTDANLDAAGITEDRYSSFSTFGFGGPTSLPPTAGECTMTGDADYTLGTSCTPVEDIINVIPTLIGW